MAGIRKGQDWGTSASGDEGQLVSGTDADLAQAWFGDQAARFRFEPRHDSALAATLGLGTGHRLPRQLVSIDVMLVRCDGGDPRPALGSVELIAEPHQIQVANRRRRVRMHLGAKVVDARVAGVLVANAQHVAGRRVVPRGHPGDGRFELQWYGIKAGDRAKFRARLVTGSHLDHPDVGSAWGQSLRVEASQPVRIWVDRVRQPRAATVDVTLVPGALQLLI